MKKQISWAVSESGFIHLPVERRSGAEDYLAQMEHLLAQDEGYSEVSCNDQLYPRVSFAFRASYGVVECWTSSEEMFLLLGDGVISNDETISVPELEGDAEYTGAFVSSRQRAWDVVKKFIALGSVDSLGEWAKL